MITRAEFKLRPRAQRGESLPGFLYRVYEENGHALPQAVTRLFAPINRCPNGDVCALAANTIGTVLGGDSDFDWSQWVKIAIAQPRNARGVRLAIDQRCRLCPKCFAQYGYHLAIWQLDSVYTCPVHQCDLVSNCHECRTDLRWDNLQLDWRCRCGRPLLDMPADQCPLISTILATQLACAPEVVWPKRYSPYVVGPLGGRRQPLATAYRLVQLLRKLGCAQFPDDRARSLITNWPNVVQDLLLDAAKSRWSDQQALLLVTSSDEAARIGILQLCALPGTLRRCSPIGAALKDIIRQYIVSAAPGHQLIFSPYTTRVEQVRRVRTLLRWWRRSSPHLRDAPEGRAMKGPGPNSRYDHSLAIAHTTVRLINCIDAAAKGRATTAICRALQETWPYRLPTMRSDCHHALTKALMRQIAKLDRCQLDEVGDNLLGIGFRIAHHVSTIGTCDHREAKNVR